MKIYAGNAVFGSPLRQKEGKMRASWLIFFFYPSRETGVNSRSVFTPRTSGGGGSSSRSFFDVNVGTPGFESARSRRTGFRTEAEPVSGRLFV